MQPVLLGLGSNRSFNDLKPVQLLAEGCGKLELLLRNVKFSSVYKTKAMYVEDQDDFYNMAAFGYVEDEADPFELLNQLQKIEAEGGRDRSREIRFGPRSLDIDIELFGNKKINTDILQVPHIRMEERAFVLIPVLEIFLKSADEEIWKKYSGALEILKKNGRVDGIEKFLDKEDFYKIISRRKVQNDSDKGSSIG